MSHEQPKPNLPGVEIATKALTIAEGAIQHAIEAEARANAAEARAEAASIKAKELMNLAYKDELTGIFNRRGFFEVFESIRQGNKNSGISTNYSVLLFDVDKFKGINDNFGHAVGDRTLKRVARITNENVDPIEDVADHTRSSDVVARFGGDEFAVLLTGADEEQATVVANKLLEAIGHSTKGSGAKVTIGVAQVPAEAKDLEETLDMADKSLYVAKERGRNQVASYSRDVQTSQPAVTS